MVHRIKPFLEPPAYLGILLLSVALSAMGATTSTWKLERESSKIELVGVAEGRKAVAEVGHFDANVDLNLKNPSASSVVVIVDAASITTGDATIDAMLHGRRWFKAERYPEIVFRSTEILGPSEGKMSIEGELNVLDTTREVVVPMEIEQAESRIHVQGSLELDRTDYDVGQAAWRSDDTVGHEAKVVFDLTLVR